MTSVIMSHPHQSRDFRTMADTEQRSPRPQPLPVLHPRNLQRLSFGRDFNQKLDRALVSTASIGVFLHGLESSRARGLIGFTCLIGPLNGWSGRNHLCYISRLIRQRRKLYFLLVVGVCKSLPFLLGDLSGGLGSAPHIEHPVWFS